jgi:CTP synthase
MFCNVMPEAVITNMNVETLYEVPLMLAREGFDNVVCKKLNLTKQESDLTEWKELVDHVRLLSTTREKVKIAIVGKYVTMPDAYLSVSEALRHAGYANDTNLGIEFISAEDVERAAQADGLADIFKGISGILVPGGFGERGFEGKMLAARYARHRNIPYFGICFGMHAAVVDFAREVLQLPTAHTTEFDVKTSDPIIHILPNKKKDSELGGTLRLGNYPCILKKGSLAERIYGSTSIVERHRHRYEFNTDYIPRFEAAGMEICGTSPDGALPEMVEIPAHKWFLAVQFHPEC